MNDALQHLLTIFGTALECASPEEQRAYLDRACAGDVECRARVEELLRAHEQAGNFLQGEQPTTAPGPQATDTVAGEIPGASIGPYRLVRELGEGGMGTVWLAEQQEPVQRTVALKVIKPGMDSRQIIARFEAERQALALMDHPNIARVFDAGTTANGRPYFVMELVQGVPLTRYCDEHRLTPRQRLELFVPVCQAVQHAHQKGIIHRDLKPSNVLVTLYDGRPVPKVIDFGIAKATGQLPVERTMFTEVGQVVGTLEYMSPEQAELNPLDIDTRSDVYSLGVLLYELLTGSTPLQRKRVRQAAMVEVLRLIREEEPPRPSARLSTTDELPSVAAKRGLEPRKLRGLVRGELDWVVMRCLEKDRNRRYDTANGLAQDIERYLHDEAVQACPPSAWYRFRKFARRNRAALATAAVVAAALLTALVVLGAGEWRVREALHEKATAEEQRADAEKQRADKETERAEAEKQRGDEQTKRAEAEKERAEANQRWRQTTCFEQIGLARHEYLANNLARANEMLDSDRCPEDLRRWEWRYLKRLCHSELSVTRLEAPESYQFITLSPDGTRVAVLRDRNQYLPDGAVNLITQGIGGQALAPAGAPFGPLAQFAVALQTAQFTASARVIRLYDTATGKQVRSCLVRGYWPKSAAFSPAGQWLAACGTDQAPTTSVRVWNALTGEEGPLLRGADRWERGGFGEAPLGVVAGMGYLHLQSTVAAQTLAPAGGGLSLAVQLLWTHSVVLHAELMSIWPGEMGGVALSPDGQLVAATDQKGRLQAWERASGKELYRRAAHPIVNEDIRGNNFWHTSLVFSPDGKLIATACSDDGTFKLWDARTGHFVRSLWQGPLDKEEGFFKAAFSPQGKWIAAAGRHHLRFPDPSVRVWEVAAGRTRYVFRGSKVFNCLAFSPDESLLAAGSDDNTLTIWELATGREVAVYRGHEGGVVEVAFRGDGRVVSLDGNRTLRAWDATRCPEYRTFRTWTAHHAAFSSDGRRLAAAASQFDPADPENKGFHTFVWDADTGRMLMKCWDKGDKESPRQVAFNPDGKLVAAAISIGIAEGVVRIFDVETGKIVRSLPEKGARGAAHILAQGLAAQGAAPAGAPLGALAQTLAALPAMTLEVFTAGMGPCDAVAWSPDGKLIASAGQERTVLLWDAATGELVRVLPGHARSISALAFSRDGKRLASASGGLIRHRPRPQANPLNLPEDWPKDIPDVKVWDVATGKELRSWSLPGKGPGMALSPDGETIAVTFGENNVNIYLTFFLGGGSRVMWRTSASRVPDVVRCYSVATGAETVVLKGHSSAPWDVAFSPDGLRIVTGGGVDETIKLWDARTGEEIMTVGRHPGIVTCVAFSPDGQKIVSTSNDLDVRIWDAAPAKK
jgi:WD40 repeat protein/serine/threonine protein kinase